MLEIIGTTFPKTWQYGPSEIEIFNSTAEQIKKCFPENKNLLINSTWFGPQFDNNEWHKLLRLDCQIDNLFLLCVIDPFYLQPQDLDFIIKKFQVKKTFYIGMFTGSPYEWNFHAVVVNDLAPSYQTQDLLMKEPQHVFMLYQRKPRQHRIEITNILLSDNLAHRGVVTLGDNSGSNYDWMQGSHGPVLTIDDWPGNYQHDGQPTDFAGIPNDLSSLGRLDLWQSHFLNIVSETEFDDWKPTFVTEKTWKPIIGLRPFVVHGQRSTYAWLRKHGFMTFNHYWPHISIEKNEDQHGAILEVIHFLCSKSQYELMDLYQIMLPDLVHNKERYIEFANEQKNKMHHLFDENL